MAEDISRLRKSNKLIQVEGNVANINTGDGFCGDMVATFGASQQQKKQEIMESEGSEEGDDEKLSGGEGSGSDDQYFSADENVDTDSGTRGASVHHHHYHDRRVQIHGSVGIVASGYGNRGKMKATVGTCQDLMKTQEVISKELDDWTRGMVETSALRKVMEMLNNGTTWITIKGSPGEGKTTVAKMALRQLQKSGRQVFEVTSPEEFNEVTKTHSKPVIMLDDILGALEFDQINWSKWEAIFYKVLGHKEHRSHEVQTSEKDDVTVLLVGRDYVLNGASVHMGTLYDFIIKDSHVVDMSHSVERPLDEKQKIWDAIIGCSGIPVPQHSIDYIFELKGQHGFPHVCRLFATMRQDDPTIPAETFFETPLTFLSETVKKFLENDIKLQLFKEMIKRHGKISERDLENVDNGSKVKKQARELIITYLRLEGGYFVFDHPSIYDCVAFNLCNDHTLFVIENCTLSFIHERLRLSEHDTSGTDLVKYISECYVEDLAKRFALELPNKRNGYLVLYHQACTQEVFVKEMMSRLAISLTDLVKMTYGDGCDHEDYWYFDNFSMRFLSLIAASKSPQLLKYIDNHLLLTQGDIDDIMYGVCRYAASDVLSYLKPRADTLRLNIRMDITYGIDEFTPLMIAAGTRDSHFVGQILSFKPDLSISASHQRPAIYHLCSNGLVSAVMQVIDLGYDIDICDEDQFSPLSCSSKNFQMDLAKQLIEEEVIYERTRSIQPSYSEIKESRKSVLPTLLMAASECGYVEVMHYLIDHGVFVDADDGNWCPLHAACDYDKPQSVQCLLEYSADINCRDRNGDTPLHIATQKVSKECVEMLLNAGADVNVQGKNGDTTLHIAIERRSIECVDILLKAKASVNIQDDDGYTPLHKAVMSASNECIDVLRDTGAENGDTPLHKAGSLCQILISHDADVNKQDREGNTPLHFLCRVEREDEMGQDVSISYLLYEVGAPPLASSYEDVYRRFVTLLVDHGADVNILNNKGEPALRGWCQTLYTVKHQ